MGLIELGRVREELEAVLGARVVPNDDLKTGVARRMAEEVVPLSPTETSSGRSTSAAIDAIRGHVSRGALTDGLVFDAVRIRLPEIGEAVEARPEELPSTEGAIPWSQVARQPPRPPLLRYHPFRGAGHRFDARPVPRRRRSVPAVGC